MSGTDGAASSMRTLTHVQVHDDLACRIDRAVSVDSTIVCAHQHAAGTRKKREPDGTPGVGGRASARAVPGWADHQSHLAVAGRGLPLSIVLMSGNVNDCAAFPQVLAAIVAPWTGPGRPRSGPIG